MHANSKSLEKRSHEVIRQLGALGLMLGDERLQNRHQLALDFARRQLARPAIAMNQESAGNSTLAKKALTDSWQ